MVCIFQGATYLFLIINIVHRQFILSIKGSKCHDKCGNEGHCPSYCGEEGYCCKSDSKSAECENTSKLNDNYHVCTGLLRVNNKRKITNILMNASAELRVKVINSCLHKDI